MMPLCTTASRSVACGCALFSVGLPWVAQRVWPMPIVPLSGSLRQPRFQIAQLALGAAARQRAVLERGHAGGVVAAIFEALERIDELPRDRLTAENSNNPAQSGLYPSLQRLAALRCGRRHASPFFTKLWPLIPGI